ncbi:MAG: phosphatidate cytidylyltransferase [Rhodospirillaceae bacterium]|nr:phosphatidate cytidylyltransferase [Rhodospirillaceae bacterium]
MFWTRVASGVVLAPLFLALVYWEKPYFHIMVAAIAGIMAYEFLRMDGKAGPKRQGLAIAGIVAAVLAMTFVSATAALALGAAVGLAGIVSDKAAGRKERHVAQIAVPYVLLPALSLLHLMDVGGAQSVFWLLAVIWATDIGAYICGRLIGGPKLAPAVSPKKTWSGAVGGLIWAVIASSGVYWAYQGAFVPSIAAIAGLLSVISQAGDLFESSLKRRYDVKDSGALIPGHGGLMDRFDGLWAAAPFAAVFCVILGGGVQHW